MNVMKDKELRRKADLKESQYIFHDKLTLRELVTEHICQLLKASMAVHTYALKNGRVRELFFHLFCERFFPMTLRNSGLFVQLVLDKLSRWKTAMRNEMSFRYAFDFLIYSHAIICITRRVGKKKRNFTRSTVNGTLAGMAVMDVQKTWNAMAKL